MTKSETNIEFFVTYAEAMTFLKKLISNSPKSFYIQKVEIQKLKTGKWFVLYTLA